MANSFCTRCNGEVEDAGGYCLLGHELRPEPVADSLSALRAEVNRTFDEARQRLVPPAPPVELRDGLDPEPPAPVGPAPAALEHRPDVLVSAPAASQGTVWDELDDAPLAPGDPIASFAPEPRMDWGPRKARFLRKRPRHAELQPER